MYSYIFNFKFKIFKFVVIFFWAVLIILPAPEYDYFHGRKRLNFYQLDYNVEKSFFAVASDRSMLIYIFQRLRSYYKFYFKMHYDYNGINVRERNKYIFDDYTGSTPVSSALGFIPATGLNNIRNNLDKLDHISGINSNFIYFVHPTEDLFLHSQCDEKFSNNDYLRLLNSRNYLKIVNLSNKGCKSINDIYYKYGTHYHRDGVKFAWNFINNELNKKFGRNVYISSNYINLIKLNERYSVEDELLAFTPDNGLYSNFWGVGLNNLSDLDVLINDAPVDLFSNIKIRYTSNGMITEKNDCKTRKCEFKAVIVGDSFLTYLIPYYANYFDVVQFIKPEVNFYVKDVDQNTILIFNHIVRNLHFDRVIIE